ncbi:acyltransferase [[Limnothrix rosea] IAM M-220]|uniref:acyltransferase n=1 Tax=[Limnothrix rosea] IAM M-220 TaxID=454133 RepID=UPI0009FEC08C|nr:hypothetical protein [[Limnothrix rosea] IAM M-220]
MTSGAVFNSDIHIAGDVRIDDHAVIAPGVVILAAPNCSVAIAPGVCLGMGCILQASQGNIEIHKGAMIGAGVLIIGKVTIGENSCVGYGSTIFQTSLAAGSVLPPNSLIGDTSRRINTNSTKPRATSPQSPQPQAVDPWSNETAQSTDKLSQESEETATANYQEKTIPIKTEIAEVAAESTPEKSEEVRKEPVVGQVYINQLLMTLFPHNVPIKPPDSSS